MFVKPQRRVERVFIHCTAYPHGDLFGDELRNAVNSWHVARGWDQIGYHFLIDRRGELIQGRSLEMNPIAQSGHNSRTIAVCLDGLRVDDFSDAQFDTLRKLAGEIDAAYGVGGVTYHGHCEVSPKACPVFDYKVVLGLDSRGFRNGQEGQATERPITFHEIEEVQARKAVSPGIRTLEATMRGQDVAWVQKVLGCEDDGIFGQDTRRAVVGFQSENDLVPDGIVGQHTWAALFQVYGRPER